MESAELFLTGYLSPYFESDPGPLELNVGQAIAAEILSKNADELIISLMGRRISARSELPLESGDRVNLIVTSMAKGGLVFKIVKENTVSMGSLAEKPSLEQIRQPSSEMAITQTILHAAEKMDARLTDASVKNIVNFILENPLEIDSVQARLLIITESLGLPLSRQILDSMETFLQNDYKLASELSRLIELLTDAGERISTPDRAWLKEALEQLSKLPFEPAKISLAEELPELKPLLTDILANLGEKAQSLDSSTVLAIRECIENIVKAQSGEHPLPTSNEVSEEVTKLIQLLNWALEKAPTEENIWLKGAMEQLGKLPFEPVKISLAEELPELKPLLTDILANLGEKAQSLDSSTVLAIRECIENIVKAQSQTQPAPTLEMSMDVEIGKLIQLLGGAALRAAPQEGLWLKDVLEQLTSLLALDSKGSVLKETLNVLGLRFENLLAKFVEQDVSPSGIQKDLKSLLMSILVKLREYEYLPTRELIRECIHNLIKGQGAQQLLARSFSISKQVTQNCIYLQLPVIDGEKLMNAQLRISKDPQGNKKCIDPNNTSVFFLLETANLGNVQVQVNIKAGIIEGELGVENDKVRSFLLNASDELKERLSGIGYGVKGIAAVVRKSFKNKFFEPLINSIGKLDLRA